MIKPIGECNDLIINIGDFHYHVDILILDIKCSSHMPLIVGSPFLATCDARTHYRTGLLDISFGNMVANFFTLSPNLDSQNAIVNFGKDFNASYFVLLKFE